MVSLKHSLGAVFSEFLNIFKDGDSRGFLGNLSQCLIILAVKVISYVSVEN